MVHWSYKYQMKNILLVFRPVFSKQTLMHTIYEGILMVKKWFLIAGKWYVGPTSTVKPKLKVFLSLLMSSDYAV